MSSSRNPGRVAGLWYLLIILIGPLRLIYIPAKLFVHGNAAATIHNIASHERLFRMGVVADLAGALALILLVLAFYRLFKGVDQSLALQVMIFGGVLPSALYLIGAASDLSTLMVARGGDFLSAFDDAQRNALAMLFLRLHDHLNSVGEALWGVWLLPLAILVFRSRFLPRFLGIWLAIAGLAWLVLCVTGVALPEYQDRLFTYLQPAFLGEMALMLWLVIKGARPEPPSEQAATPGAR